VGFLTCAGNARGSSRAETPQPPRRLRQGFIILGKTKAEQGIPGPALEKGRPGNARHAGLRQQGEGCRFGVRVTQMAYLGEDVVCPLRDQRV
jgi:hypothetical protein